MSNSNRIVLWGIGLLLLLGVAGYSHWFSTNFERYTREVRTDVSPQARNNPFLAAGDFLKRSGQAVESFSGRDLFSLPPAGYDTIFIGRHAGLFLERYDTRLIEWISRGGKLVVALDEGLAGSGQGHSLLEQLGVKLHSNVARKSAKGADKITVSFSTDLPGPFSASFDARRYLEDQSGTARLAIGREGYPNLLRYSLGSGTVSVLSDAELFSNFEIAKHDHAYLFHQLVHSPGKVWILHNADMPSLPALLWQHAPLLLAVSIAFLLLAIWSLLGRSGPLLLQREENRRNILEHIDASANYSWRIDRAQELFEANRKATEQAWRRRHPQLNTLEQKERCAWIGEKTGIAPRAIERTLYEKVSSEQDFIRATFVLQRLATRINRPGGFAAQQATRDLAADYSTTNQESK